MKLEFTEEETLVDFENLEMKKAEKKAELEGLIDELQSLLRSSGHLEPSGKVDVERRTMLIQVTSELQAEMKAKRTLIETTLREIQEGMELIKELRDSMRYSEGARKEELTSKIKVVQQKMIERKKELEEAIRALELLNMKYSKLVEGISHVV